MVQSQNLTREKVDEIGQLITQSDKFFLSLIPMSILFKLIHVTINLKGQLYDPATFCCQQTTTILIIL